MKEGGGSAAFLGGLENVVRDMEDVVEVDGEDAKVNVWDVEGGGREEDFGGGWVG
jgi:hypothetical protein